MPQLPADPCLHALLAEHDLIPEHVREISRLRTTVRSRHTFRIETSDGRVVKARTFSWANSARQVFQTLERLPRRHFPAPLGWRGHVLLEPWVDAPVLGSLSIDHHMVRACGRMLGWMSVLDAESPRLPPTTMDQRLRALSAELHFLVQGETITPGLKATVWQVATRHAPRTVSRGIVHRDLCPENLAWRDGVPVSIDNGWVGVDALPYDLARVWYRWPWKGSEWREFLTGYGDWRPTDEFLRHQGYWKLEALVRALAFHVRSETNEADRVLAILEQILANSEIPASPRNWREAS